MNQGKFPTSRTRLAVYVRFSEEEYTILSKIAESRGESLQQILKVSALNGGAPAPMFEKTDAVKVINELRRIGVNVNQIAKHLNSGFRAGWNASFSECAEDLRRMHILIRKTYGNYIPARP